MKSRKKHKLLIAVVVAALFLTMMFPASVFARNGAADGNAAVNDAEFTVQYYAGIPSYSTSGDEANALSIIDTTGENEQPANEDGSNVETRKLYLDENGQLKWEYSLSAIYAEESYSYYTAPGLNYFDKVSHSSANYDLREVWIMKASCSDSQSIKWSDWTMYQDVDDYPLQFTNDPAAVQNAKTQEDPERPGGDVVPGREDRVALIEDGAVIRLIYELNTGSGYSRDALFYDYDISDGKAYTAIENNQLTKPASAEQLRDGKTKLYIDTRQKGINSAENYTGSGAKYAFGNNNAGTQMGTIKRENYFINQANSEATNPDFETYQGVCFGLANAILPEGGGPLTGRTDLQTPKFFVKDASVIGRTQIEDWDLSFDRLGDTYTLRSVNDASGKPLASADKLNTFTGIEAWNGKMIWTNNFWPLDGASWNNTEGHDPMFGETGRRVHYVEINEKDELVGMKMPLSDDGIAHNSYFGMTYTVSFTLDEGYCGPLNYMFYGDDDMWVYLDGKLVADIGGVHSSVGIFVDFWEYIDPADTDTEHTVQIFYTERGASGSSCFMQFTIPQVQKVTPVSPVMDLVIDKTVLAADEEAAGSDTFEFEISLRDENGDSYGSAYWFYVLDENDEQVSSTLVPAGTESVRAQMKDGCKIVIPSIPVGSQYSISEITAAEKLDEELGTPAYSHDYETEASADDADATTAAADGLFTITGTAKTVTAPAPGAVTSEDSEGAHWVHFTNELIPDEPEPEPDPEDPPEPDQPPTPEDPPTPDKPDTDKPQPEEPAAPETGDNADMAVWFNVMAVCLIAMTALTFCMLRAVCGRRR